jgi:hypothetical protein
VVRNRKTYGEKYIDLVMKDGKVRNAKQIIENIIDYIEQTPNKVSLAYVPQQRKVSHYLRTNKTNYILITKNVKTGDEYRWIGDEEE